MGFLKRHNANDHRAGTNDLDVEKHTQVRLRVHRIVIGSSWLQPSHHDSDRSVRALTAHSVLLGDIIRWLPIISKLTPRCDRTQ